MRFYQQLAIGILDNVILSVFGPLGVNGNVCRAKSHRGKDCDDGREILLRENGDGIAACHALYFEHEHGLAYGIFKFSVSHGRHDTILQCDVVAELCKGTLQVCDRMLNAECLCSAVVGFHSFFNIDGWACEVGACCKFFNGFAVELEHLGDEIFRENLFEIVP